MKCYVIVLFQSTYHIIMTILIIFSSPSSRSFTFGINWSITLLVYYRLCPLRTIYWNICSLIKLLGQQIHLANYLQHFANELSLELQVHIFLTRIKIIHPTHNFQLLNISPPNVRKSNIYPQPHLGIHLCAWWNNKIICARIKYLDENYLVPDPEPIVMGEPCWLDAYTLNKLISYQILFERFVLIIIGLAIIGGIQFLLNQPTLST